VVKLQKYCIDFKPFHLHYKCVLAEVSPHTREGCQLWRNLILPTLWADYRPENRSEGFVTNSNLVQLTWNLWISLGILESHLNPVVISSFISVNVCKLAHAITHTYLPHARPRVALLFIVVYSVRQSEWESFEHILYSIIFYNYIFKLYL